MNVREQFTCPVCGFAGLSEAPRIGRTMSHEICLCCHFQFGVTDHVRMIMPSAYRGVWVAEGLPWRGASRGAPPGWDPIAQVTSIPTDVIEDYNRSLQSSGDWINPEDNDTPRKNVTLPRRDA